MTSAVDNHSACTALTMVASLFRASQMQMLAQSVEQRGAVVDFDTAALPIDFQRYFGGYGHFDPLQSELPQHSMRLP